MPINVPNLTRQLLDGDFERLTAREWEMLLVSLRHAAATMPEDHQREPLSELLGRLEGRAFTSLIVVTNGDLPTSPN